MVESPADCNPDDDRTVSVALDISVAGRPMHLEIRMAAAPTSAAALIPIARALLAAISERVVAVVNAAGQQVSCCKGCGACCRQLVPVSIAEARTIHGLVAAMPEPRRSEVRRRFAAVREVLVAAGLHDQVADLGSLPAAGRRAFSLRYFGLGLACPFLEEESCSIHQDRPLACREYLVTSPAAFCAEVGSEKIEGVPVPAAVSKALMAADPEATSEATGVALSTALDWVEEHPAPALQAVDGLDLLRRFLAHVFQRDMPAAGASTIDHAR